MKSQVEAIAGPMRVCKTSGGDARIDISPISPVRAACIGLGLAIWIIAALALLVIAPSFGEERALQPEEISLEFVDPRLDRQGISTELGGVIRGRDFHFEAHRLNFRRDTGNRRGGVLLARGGVYVQYFGARFVGQSLEYDFTKRRGVLLTARSKIGSWLVGSCEVHLFPDGHTEFRYPWAVTANAPFAEWRFRADQLTLSPEQDVSITGLQYTLGNRALARAKNVKFNARKLQRIPIQLGYQWGSKDQRRIGLTYRFLDSAQHLQLHLDRWYTQGWGFGAHARSEGPHHHWSTGHYALLEQRPHPHWRVSSSGAFRRNWDCGTRLEGKLHCASDNKFVNQRQAKSLVYRPSRTSHLFYRRPHERGVVNVLFVPKINSFDAVKQLLPAVEIHARPEHLGGGWIFDQSLNTGYLRFSYSKESQIPSFATWRTIWNTALYKNVAVAPGLNATAMVKTRTYAVSQALNGHSSLTLQPRWEGHLQSACHNEILGLPHRFFPYLHHTAYGFEQRPSLYVFDLEEAPTRVQKIEWGARGYLQRKGRDLLQYRIFFVHPLGAQMRALTKAAVMCLDWHVNRRLDLFARVDFDQRHWKAQRFNSRASATLTRSLALIAEYDRRSARSWRGISEDRTGLERQHALSELLTSNLSDQREYASGSLYWRIEPDWVVRAQIGKGFARVTGGARKRGYTEYGLIAMTVLPSDWKVQLACQHRAGKVRFYVDFSASTRAATITRRKF